MSETLSVPMDDKTKRFYQGVTAANRVIREHADVDFPDQQTRIKTFYFYVGVLAAGEHECRTQEDFTNFMLGVATRAPGLDLKGLGTCDTEYPADEHDGVHEWTEQCVGWWDA